MIHRRIPTLLLLGALSPIAAPVLAAAPADLGPRHRECATPEPTDAEREAVRARLAVEGDRLRLDLRAGGTIPVSVHVILGNGGEGNVTDGQIEEQIRVLNRGFSGTGYRFALASIDRTEKNSWFKMGSGYGAERQAKQALAIDPAHRLNLYICAPGHFLLGWAYFPWSLPEDSYWHGVVVHYLSLPGGEAPYDLGATAVHEVGHYLGLLHTFQGACAPPGDEVEDTPFEAVPAFSCVERNTCPQPGGDPIHNYMDYTDDACLTEFTSGQVTRMDAIVPVYRPSLFAKAVVRETETLAPVAQARASQVELRSVSPNPTTGDAVLRFTLPRGDHATLRVYNVAGQHVATLIDARLPEGEHSALFHTGGLTPGMYFTELRVGSVRLTRNVVVVR